MTRNQAIKLLQENAKAYPESYFSEPFTPHEWTIQAVIEATKRERDKCINDVESADGDKPAATWEGIEKIHARVTEEQRIDIAEASIL